MSGGSYDYLCFKGADELVCHQGVIDEMASRLSGLGYAQDAARETFELLQIIRAYETRVSVIRDRLEPIWRSIEWWDSGDSGEDRFKEDLEEYRNS